MQIASTTSAADRSPLARVGEDGSGPGLRRPAGPPTASAPPVATSRAKRGLDICLSAAALVLLAPLLLLAAMAIFVETGGPILFRQQRTGRAGRVFRVLKFRTMTVREDGDGVRQAQRGDARVTRVGRVLRKLSIDELPQLINVLRGEMSLVGPRPHALAHDGGFARVAPTYAERFMARPGITGLAQVSGLRGETAGEASIILRTVADIRYIQTWSLMGDLRIMARTLRLIFDDPQAF
jgi:putative colanic acid biosynthesis UDP-glucose lipid carrier transferase